MPFIGKQSSANSKIKKYSYTATANQTNFAVVSGSGDELQVFFNGVKLKETDDYTFSTSQVTLGAGASSGDIVDIHVFSSFLIADAVSSSTGGPFGTGNNEYSLPTVRATENDQVLQMTNISNGTVEWKDTVTDPSITGVTGHLNATESTGEGGGGTLVITGADLGTNISQVTDVSICNSSGGSAVPATTKSLTSSNTEITATWTGNESGYSTFSGVYYVKLTKSGKTSNIFNTTKNFSADPTISSVTGTGGEGENVTVSSSNLGTYGGTIAGGGQDSNTKLLLNFDRTGGTDIEDSSNSGGEGHKVTATNQAIIKASPFGDGKSGIFFDGTNDYLQVANTLHNDLDSIGTGAFTIECWINPSTSTTEDTILNFGRSDNTWSYGLHIGYRWDLSPKKFTTYINATERSYQFDMVAGRWYHIAWVRDASGYVKFYIDGVAYTQTAGAGSDSYQNTTDLDLSWDECYIGRMDHSGVYPWDGYMDEIRFTTTAVYSGDFTVPTSRLTAITNTKLLIHSDQSDHLFWERNPTIGGGAVQVNDSVAKTNRGSTSHTNWNSSAWKFDGTGDYLHIPNVNSTPIGTGDYTVDFWIYPQSQTGSYGQVFDLRDSNATNGFVIEFHNTNPHLKFYDSALRITTANNSVPLNTWTHIAVERNNTTTRIYINGTADSSTSSTNDNYSTNTVRIAQYIGHTTQADYAFTGYIDSFRVSGTARYSGTNFSAPTSPPSVDANTRLLIHGDGAFFDDSSTSDHDITPTGSYHSQAHGGIAPAMAWPASKKLTGSAGIYFDGNGDYLSIPASTDFHIALDTSAYHFGTIEAYIYPTFSSGTGAIISSTHSSSQASNYWSLKLVNGYLEWEVRGAGTLDITHSDAVIPTSTWTHVAVTRTHSGSTATYKIYVNGTEKGTGTSTGFASFAGSVLIGANNTGSVGEYFQGYIDHLRFRLGSTSSATVTPTASTLPTKIYGAMFPRNPSVGTITITGATTDSTDIAFTEISSSLPNGLTLNDQGAGNQTATITGTLTDFVTSDTTTSNIRIQAKANNDAKRITEVNESSGTGNVSITKKAGGEPVLFNARRFASTGTDRTINGYGFQPDLIWIKARDKATNHYIQDSVRGAQNLLLTNDTNAEFVNDRIDGFVSDGVKITNDNEFNDGSASYSAIAWGWKAGGAPSGTFPSSIPSSGIANGTFDANSAGYSSLAYLQHTTSGQSISTQPYIQTVNQNSGFSITKYRGGVSDGSSNTGVLAHNLGSTPDWVIIKRTSGVDDWYVWHKDLSSGYVVTLNGSGAQFNTDAGGLIGTVNSTTISLNAGSSSAANVNQIGGDYICYAFKSVSGVSAFGSYVGTGGALSVTDQSGATNCGFNPRWLMIKKLGSGGSGSGPWLMFDSFRDTGTLDNYIRANEANSEDDTIPNFEVNFQNSGFEYTSATNGWWMNESGQTYIYIAFA